MQRHEGRVYSPIGILAGTEPTRNIFCSWVFYKVDKSNTISDWNCSSISSHIVGATSPVLAVAVVAVAAADDFVLSSSAAVAASLLRLV
jgi:hypothetical protein